VWWSMPQLSHQKLINPTGDRHATSEVFKTFEVFW
jgi:hypothetical protein